MKIKATIDFLDLKESIERKIGDVWDADIERAENLSKIGYASKLPDSKAAKKDAD